MVLWILGALQTLEVMGYGQGDVCWAREPVEKPLLLTRQKAKVPAKEQAQCATPPLKTARGPATVAPPRDGEVCFSPSEPCDEKLRLFIASARKSLAAAVYDINLDAVVHAFIERARVVPVRIVTDRRQSQGNHSAVRVLKAAGVQVRMGHQRGYMHNKFTLVDADRLQTGSFNYTFHAFSANAENQLYLRVPAIVRRYLQYFEELWAKATP